MMEILDVLLKTVGWVLAIIGFVLEHRTYDRLIAEKQRANMLGGKLCEANAKLADIRKVLEQK